LQPRPAQCTHFGSQNDAIRLADLKSRTRIPLACGQNEGLAFRFRDLLVANSVDVLQPNVAITGGYTQCLKIAGMAAAFNTAIANGGAWTFHNMHLHAGVANGGLVEYHIPAVNICSQIFKDLPLPQDGWLTLPDKPGLGFEPDHAAIKELAKRPTARGRGKG
jgi:L-rhamnonate dehydratase